ncbi:hypothetical protein, partial [Staphylococcus gallinarum]|uniref:hypothetical protein n=2 Tax=Staphylococcus gallinarum TaxID=1293 RepID=UPI001F53FCA3
KVEVGNMSMDYITRPEFEEHKKHLDTRFDNLEDRIESNKVILSKDINVAVSNLKDEIAKDKVTTKRFWIGIAIPALISIAGVIVSIFT